MNGALYVDLMPCFLDLTVADTNMNGKRTTFIMHSAFPSHSHTLTDRWWQSYHASLPTRSNLGFSILTWTRVQGKPGIEPPALQISGQSSLLPVPPLHAHHKQDKYKNSLELDLNSLSLSVSWREEDEWWFCSVSLWQASTLLVSDSSLPSRTLNNKLPSSSSCLSVSLSVCLSLTLTFFPPCLSRFVFVWLI